MKEKKVKGLEGEAEQHQLEEEQLHDEKDDVVLAGVHLSVVPDPVRWYRCCTSGGGAAGGPCVQVRPPESRALSMHRPCAWSSGRLTPFFAKHHRLKL